MKLSEAIRLGATLSKQIRGALKDDDGGTCAIGSALEAVGLDASNPLGVVVASCKFPVFNVVVETPSVFTTKRTASVSTVIIALNDHKGWTREQIADWVETIEAQHPELESSPSPISIPEPVTA